MKQMRVVTFLFFSIFCAEDYLTEKPKEKINWGLLIAQIQKKDKFTLTEERAFESVKTGVRCFLGTPYDVRCRTKGLPTQQELPALNDVVLTINGTGVLECSSFVGIVQAILSCRNSRNFKLLDLWKYETTQALDALTSGCLISRKTIPERLLKDADKVLIYRTFPIVEEAGDKRALPEPEELVVSRMASLQATPVSSPQKYEENGRVVPNYFVVSCTCLARHLRSSSECLPD